jgi:hypothetical protein
MHPSTWVPWVALLGIILGARLWLISGYGSALPILDQRDAEDAYLFKPWLENTLRWPDLFSPHNEHRIVFSRLLALGLLAANGQWDALLEMTANAMLCGLIGLGIAGALLKRLGNEYRTPVLVAVTLWLALPYASKNTVWAFNPHFTFCFVSLSSPYGGLHSSRRIRSVGGWVASLPSWRVSAWRQVSSRRDLSSLLKAPARLETRWLQGSRAEQFEVAGSLARGLSLSLRDDETGNEERVNSKARVNENWRSAIVPLPGSNVHIIANDIEWKESLNFRPRDFAVLDGEQTSRFISAFAFAKFR